VHSSITRGAFATVCRGQKGDTPVAIKIVRHSLLEKVSDKFKTTVVSRQRLTNQCFIKVLEFLNVPVEHEEYSVVIEELVRNDAKILSEHLKKERCQIDEVATAVRRAAEALNQFHQSASADDSRYGLMTPKHIYYDKRSGLLLMPAVGVSNFLWRNLGWDRFSAWQDATANDATYVSPEEATEKTFGPEKKNSAALTDQYYLGQIAFEMLEGKLGFKIGGPRDVHKKEDFWNDARSSARGNWPKAHAAFAKIIFRMLERNPRNRWQSFDELIMRLRAMEDESRALAKRTYEGIGPSKFCLKGNEEFFKSFYSLFVERAESAKGKFSDENQHKKLMSAMVAVFNFHAGNEPTALGEIVNKHRKFEVTALEIDEFVATFIDTLETKLSSKVPKAQIDQIIRAWKELFSPIVEYFKEKLAKEGLEDETKPVRRNAVGNVRERGSRHSKFQHNSRRRRKDSATAEVQPFDP
jgi:hypothetical protein